MFGGFPLMGYDEDPFMAPRNMMSQMDRMMGQMNGMMRGGDPFAGGDPFFPGMMGGHQQALQQVHQNQSALQQAHQNQSALQQAHQNQSALQQAHQRTSRAPPPMMGALSPFGGLGSMMASMDNMSRDGSCQTFSSSSVMTMSTGPDGRPQVYQATSSSRGVPGGAQETKRTVMDSASGTRKMAIGHHINDRAHVIEKEMKRDGDLEEREEFVNLDEEEAPQFNSEFQRLTQQAYGQNALESRHHNRHSRATSQPSHQRSTYMNALPAPSSAASYRRRSRPLLSLTHSSSRPDDSNRHGGNRRRNH